MKWYNYLFSFFTGVFIANTIPHLINGISGNFFPTPFSNPPGKGISSPTINFLWSLVNIIIVMVLLNYNTPFSLKNRTASLLLLAGFAIVGTVLSIGFSTRM